jgi:hypothetical protein
MKFIQFIIMSCAERNGRFSGEKINGSVRREYIRKAVHSKACKLVNSITEKEKFEIQAT